MRVALVALVVLLAGCPAVGGPGEPTTTITPAPVPQDRSYPPGIGPAGVEDAGALGTAHSDLLDDTSYTIVSNRTIRTRNGSLRSLLAVRVALSSDRSYHVTARTAGEAGPVFMGLPPARGEYWSNGTVYVRLLERDDRRLVNRFEPPDNFVGTWRYWRSTVAFGGGASFDQETVGTLFESVPTRLAGNRTSNGTTLYVLEGDRAVDTDFAKVGTGPVSNVSLSATVSQDGIVRSFDLTYDRRMDGSLVRVHWRLRYVDIGSTAVDQPPWVAEALATVDAGNRSAASARAVPVPEATQGG